MLRGMVYLMGFSLLSLMISWASLRFVPMDAHSLLQISDWMGCRCSFRMDSTLWSWKSWVICIPVLFQSPAWAGCSCFLLWSLPPWPSQGIPRLSFNSVLCSQVQWTSLCPPLTGEKYKIVILGPSDARICLSPSLWTPVITRGVGNICQLQLLKNISKEQTLQNSKHFIRPPISPL